MFFFSKLESPSDTGRIRQTKEKQKRLVRIRIRTLAPGSANTHPIVLGRYTGGEVSLSHLVSLLSFSPSAAATERKEITFD